MRRLEAGALIALEIDLNIFLKLQYTNFYQRKIFAPNINWRFNRLEGKTK